MSRREAIAAGPRPSWKRQVAFVTSLLTIIVSCVAIGRFWGPGSATAQSPVRNTRPAPRQPQRAPATTRQLPPNNRATTFPRTATTTARPAVNAAANRTPQQTPSPNSIVAEVNNERILRRELASECLRRFGTDVLESIVNRQVIWQACQRKNITITEQDVDEEINRVASRFGLSVDRWIRLLSEERNISSLKYRNEIIWPTIALRRLASAQLVVSEEEIRQAIESQFGPKVRTRIIAHSKLETAKSLLAKVRANPEGFGDLAKDFSEDENSASARGLIPPIRKHVGDKKVEETAFALAEGEISDIIFVANQYIIIKCEQHVDQTYLTPPQLTAATDRVKEQLRDQKLRTEASKLFKQLQKEAQVVNVFNNPQASRQQPGVAAMINGQPITMDFLAEECVVRHGSEVLDIEVNRRLLLQALKRRGASVGRADIDFEIARAADAYGFHHKDGKPDVKAWLDSIAEGDKAKTDIYVQDAVWPSAALKKLVTSRIEVTEDDMKKGFEANYGERVQVLAIVVGSSREAQKVWDQARKNPTDEYFGELAHNYSIEPISKANYGKVSPIRRFAGHEALEKEAFRLKPGELSGLIEVGERTIILRCLGRTKPIVAGLEEVQTELRRDLHEKKLRVAMAEEFERLKKSARIKTHLGGAPQVVRPASATRPVGPPARTGAPTTRPLNGRPAPRTRSATRQQAAPPSSPRR